MAKYFTCQNDVKNMNIYASLSSSQLDFKLLSYFLNNRRLKVIFFGKAVFIFSSFFFGRKLTDAHAIPGFTLRLSGNIKSAVTFISKLLGGNFGFIFC